MKALRTVAIFTAALASVVLIGCQEAAMPTPPAPLEPEPEPTVCEKMAGLWTRVRGNYVNAVTVRIYEDHAELTVGTLAPLVFDIQDCTKTPLVGIIANTSERLTIEPLSDTRARMRWSSATRPGNSDVYTR